MLLIPYELDLAFARRPIVNWLLVGSIVLVFILQLGWVFSNTEAALEGAESPFEPYVLDGWGLRGLIGHMWIHGGIFHIIGNAIFLWLFGNAINQKLGHLMFFPIYLFLGLFAAMTHLVFNGNPAVGASGAINGLVGMYLIFYPTNDISCIYCFAIWASGTFSVSGYWMILLWLVFDIVGVLLGGTGVGYWAHIGGFAAGVTIAIVLLLTKVVVMDRDEESLLQIFSQIGKPAEPIQRYDTMDAMLVVEQMRQQRDDSFAAPPQTKVREDIAIAPSEGSVTISREKPPSVPTTHINNTAQSDDWIRFYCPCGQKIKMPKKFAGRTGKCPKCRKRIVIPEVA
ncbi:MAG: rhomboid family intramembrane serine protease [Sedimentisphaerales bacterium]|nr:rhomboid family intramembrane serine protease [Sedimentisphaerales bacterium]